MHQGQTRTEKQSHDAAPRGSSKVAQSGHLADKADWAIAGIVDNANIDLVDCAADSVKGMMGI